MVDLLKVVNLFGKNGLILRAGKVEEFNLEESLPERANQQSHVVEDGKGEYGEELQDEDG